MLKPLLLAISFMSAADPPPPPPHIGGYIPNSQLLSWCKSKEAGDFQTCWSFIEAVVESSGITETRWPEGPIELPPQVFGNQLIPIVVRHLEGLAPEKMSSPAVRSVYDAVVAAYPYKEPQAPAEKPATK
jgi:hypothetical protein